MRKKWSGIACAAILAAAAAACEDPCAGVCQGPTAVEFTANASATSTKTETVSCPAGGTQTATRTETRSVSATGATQEEANRRAREQAQANADAAATSAARAAALAQCPTSPPPPPPPPPPPSCTFTLTPITASVEHQGAIMTASVDTNRDDCSWQANSGASWIATTASGRGDGTFQYTVAQNLAGERKGQITITGGATLTVVQAAAPPSPPPPPPPPPQCQYAVNVGTTSFSSAPAQEGVIVSASPGCTWQVMTNQQWFGISPASGSGNGSFTIAIQSNTGSQREGQLTFTGQNGFTRQWTITQAAGPQTSCTPQVAPQSHNFPASGGQVQISVNVAAGCQWSVNLGQTSWIASGTQSGTGPASFTLTAQPNSGAQRGGSITVAGQNVNVSQDAATTTACQYAVQVNPVSFGPQPAQQGVIVSATPGCTWSITSSQFWIGVSTPAGNGSGSGNGNFTLTIAGNGGAARQGTLTFSGQNFSRTWQISQSAAP